MDQMRTKFVEKKLGTLVNILTDEFSVSSTVLPKMLSADQTQDQEFAVQKDKFNINVISNNKLPIFIL